MQMLLVLLVISIPILGLAGLIVALAAAAQASRLRKRIDELEYRQPIGPNHPISRTIQVLQERVAALEKHPPEAAEPAPERTEPKVARPPVPPQPPVEAPPVALDPPVRIGDRPPEPGPSDAPPSALPPAATGAAAAEPLPVAPRPAPRPRIEWERWIGVRGAAAAGGIVLALAALLFFQYSIEHGLISPTMRVVLGVIVGICCLVGSEWLVKRDQAAAANALAGAGVVILYGATWAAQNLYGLIGVGARLRAHGPHHRRVRRPGGEPQRRTSSPSSAFSAASRRRFWSRRTSTARQLCSATSCCSTSVFCGWPVPGGGLCSPFSALPARHSTRRSGSSARWTTTAPCSESACWPCSASLSSSSAAAIASRHCCGGRPAPAASRFPSRSHSTSPERPGSRRTHGRSACCS